MKKCAILFLLAAAMAILASCSKDDVLNLKQFGVISFNGFIPGPTSKVPTCKAAEPTKLLFDLTDESGFSWPLISDIENNNGAIKSISEMKLPVGRYVVSGIYLTGASSDTLYSIPHQSELHLLRFSSTAVPFEILVGDATDINGNMLCFTPQGLSPEDVISGGFTTERLQSLWFDVQSECIDQVTVEVDAYRILEVYPFQLGRYEVAIPEEYQIMFVRSYVAGSLFQSYSFSSESPYNPDGVIDHNDVILLNASCE